jgi:3-hydroxyisobutyrate dehydrogenase
MSTEPSQPIAPPAKIGFFGLGAMGCGMAVNLVRAGFQVSAYDPSPAAQEQFRTRSGIATVIGPEQACKDQDAIVTMLGDGKLVRQALLGGPSPVKLAKRGALVVDCSSSSPVDTLSTEKELAALGFSLVDSPVSGAEKGATEGTLTLMVGGSKENVARADKILHAMGKSIFHTGPLGAGHAMKTINNYLAAANLISALQGVLIGKKYGLDPEQMIDIINVSYGRNTATEFVVKQQILSEKFAANFKMWLAAKDARVMDETAQHVGYSGTLPHDIRTIFEDAEKKFGRDVDFTNVYKFLDGFWDGGNR